MPDQTETSDRATVLAALTALIPGATPENMTVVVTERTPEGDRHAWSGTLIGLAQRMQDATAQTADSVTEYGVRVPIDNDTNQIIGVSVDRDTTEGALRDHRSIYPASGQVLVQRTATRGPWTNIEAGAR